jgi:hypothetical protein
MSKPGNKNNIFINSRSSNTHAHKKNKITKITKNILLRIKAQIEILKKTHLILEQLAL